MTLSAALAAADALFNAVAASFMVAGVRAIKRRKVKVHRRRMLIAFGASCAFLTSYLVRHALYGETHFAHQGWIRIVYFVVLIPHVLLALVVLPLILRSLYLGLKRKFRQHPRIARVAYPLWLYVSVTGVLVYLMLYHLPG